MKMKKRTAKRVIFFCLTMIMLLVSPIVFEVITFPTIDYSREEVVEEVDIPYEESRDFIFAWIDGESMEPTLKDGSCVTIYRDVEPKYYDIVSVRPHQHDDLHIIKRIVGMPGDTLVFDYKSGKMYRNGEEEVGPLSELCTTSYIEEVTLDENSYFVVGDNREASFDSRDFGPVYREDITGVYEEN